MRHLESNTLFITSTNHFHWDPRHDYAKFAQAYLLQVKIEEMQERVKNEMPEDYNENMPVFVVGDFNSKPSSSVVQFFYGQGLNYSLKEDMDHSIMEYTNKTKAFNKRDKYYKEIQGKLKGLKMYQEEKYYESAYEHYNKEFNDDLS